MTADDLLHDAFALHRAGRFDQAETIYREVLVQDGDNLNALQLLGAVASDTGRGEEAITWLDRAAEVLAARGGADAQHAALYHNLGNALVAAGRFDEAAARYRIGLTLDQGIPELWARLASALALMDDHAGAAAALDAALTLRPGQADWRLMRGSINAELGRPEDAARDFCGVLADEPAHAQARRALGLLLLSNRIPAAADCFARSMALHPGDAESHWMLGRIAEAGGDFAAAQAAYRRALGQDPALPAALFDLGTLLYRELGQPAEALALFDRLAESVPGHVGVHCARGNAWRVMRQNDQALDAYRRYLDLQPHAALAHLRVGETLAATGRAAEAAESFDRALQLGGSQDIAYLAHCGLGAALRALGRKAEATQQYRLAIAREPVARHKAASSPAAFTALLLMAPGCYNTPYEYLTERAAFETDILLLLPDQPYDAASLAAGRDVVVNLVSDVDHDDGMLAVAAALADRLGKPVINHPDRIRGTDRASVAALLSGIPDCRVAKVERYSGSALLAPGFCDRRASAFPFLARLAGRHGGDDFERLHTQDELQRFVAGHAADDYFLIEYIDTASPDGYFRKYRFFIVGDAVLPYHLAIGSAWKVHHYSTDMANQAWMRREEAAFLNDPGAVFAPRHFAALRAIRDAIGLDFFGVDCALDREGNLVVFEANATMLVHADTGDFAYKNPHVQAIKSAFHNRLAAAVLKEQAPA